VLYCIKFSSCSLLTVHYIPRSYCSFSTLCDVVLQTPVLHVESTLSFLIVTGASPRSLARSPNSLFVQHVFHCSAVARNDVTYSFQCDRNMLRLLVSDNIKTGSTNVVKDCQGYFAIDPPSCDLKRRQDKFILRYGSTVNGFCQFCNKL